MRSCSMASSAPSWSTLALTTTYIQTGSRASMDQTRELLVLVIDLNMERITPNFVSGVKVVLINWRELMAESNLRGTIITFSKSWDK